MEQLRFRRHMGRRDHRRPRERCNDAPFRSLGCSEARNCSFPP